MAVLRLEECAYCSTPTVCEIRSNGKPQCKACKVERFFEEVLYRPIGYKLLPWSRKILRDIFGTVRDDGVRQYTHAYISVAKKNGKSFLVGGLPIYHLLCEDEMDPLVYGAASAREQAALVFKAATDLIRRNPMLQDVFKVLPSTHVLKRRDGGGSYKVLSASGGANDGMGPSLAIIDELHRWKNQDAHVLYDALTRGTIARAQPLTVEITTAGEIHDSPICRKQHEFADQIRRGKLECKWFYQSIYSADEQRIKREPEYWKSREARVAANPSHEDLGGFLKDEKIVEELDKAIITPVKKNAYLRYHLNIWVETEDRLIPDYDWAKCGAPVKSLMGRECYIGIDLSSTIDLTAMVCLFPDKDGTFDVLPFFWMAEERVHERERKDRVPYSQWAKEGYLTTTTGASIERSEVTDKIMWASENFDVKEVALDFYCATEILNDLQKRGFTKVVKIPVGYQHLSEPTKKLLELCGDGRIRHGNHPLLSWNADCASAKMNDSDGIILCKPNRLQNSKRIDGISALILAIYRWIVADNMEPYFVRHGGFARI